MEIRTLVADIYSTITKKDGWFTDELAKTFSDDLAGTLKTHLSVERGPPKLRPKMSQLGPKCPCALWHSIHKPELAEKLPPWAEMKYAYGHILEALLLTLAEAAGHTVEGKQDELLALGAAGRRDAVIDGCVVDVKSANSRTFEKFKNRTIGQSDDFGYLDQIDAYLLASLSDPLVKVKDRGYLLAIDKQLGHVCLYEHIFREKHIRDRIAQCERIIQQPTAPACTCRSIDDGKSGNRILDVPASYNNFKYCCNPKIRTFLYAGGPKYFTKVVRRPEPHIIEIDKFGKMVYN